jgi:hypothetical protein
MPGGQSGVLTAHAPRILCYRQENEIGVSGLAVRLRNRGSIPAYVQTDSVTHPDCCPLGRSGRGMRLVTHPHLMSRLRSGGAIPPITTGFHAVLLNQRSPSYVLLR